MPNIVAINKLDHGDIGWLRQPDYKFAALDTVVQLFAEEMPAAVHTMPTAFIKNGDSFMLVALQGMAPGENLLVAPTGQWLAGYVPLSYRYSPFFLLPDDKGELILCVDQDSGLLSDKPEAERFFNDDGEATEKTLEILTRLTQMTNSRAYTQTMCNVLARLNLLQPWLFTTTTPEGEKSVEGVFRIDESALNSLNAQDLLELRDCGALPLIYCQLLSMQHLGSLQNLHAHRAHIKQSQESAAAGDTFSFSGLS